MPDLFDPELLYIYGWQLDAFCFDPGDVVVQITGEYACLKPALSLLAYRRFGSALEFARRYETRPTQSRRTQPRRWCGVGNLGDYLVGASVQCTATGPFVKDGSCTLSARARCSIPLRADGPLRIETDAESVVVRFRWENPEWRHH